MTSFSSLKVDEMFNSVGNKKLVYYTDKIYGYKDFQSGFNDMVNMTDFLKPLTSLYVTRYNKSVIDKIINGTLDKEAISQQAPPGDNVNWVRGNEDILVIRYTLSKDYGTDLAEKIYRDMINAVGDPRDSLVKSSFAEVATNHSAASKFMENIILAMCNWKFENVKSQLNLFVSGDTVEKKQMIDDVIQAGKETVMLPKQASIIENLHSTCSEAIATLVKNQAPSTYALEGFNENKVFAFNKFRTTLREVMFSKLILREYAGNTSISDQVLMYVRRLLVEVYIISYYPYIHFLYINALLKKFQSEGNFVNLRVAALARVAFTINMLLWYYNLSSDKFPSTIHQKVYEQVIVSEWAETLKNYMTTLSRVNFNNKEASIQNIISDLHTLSSQVVSQSMSVDELKENIIASQIQVRSILARLKQISKERTKKITQYSILVFLLLLVVAVSAVLLTFNLFKNYVLYGVIGIASTIILYKLIVSIIDLVKIAKR